MKFLLFLVAYMNAMKQNYRFPGSFICLWGGGMKDPGNWGGREESSQDNFSLPRTRERNAPTQDNDSTP